MPICHGRTFYWNCKYIGHIFVLIFSCVSFTLSSDIRAAAPDELNEHDELANKSREHITFIAPDGSLLPMADVKQRMIEFNQDTQRIFSDPGRNGQSNSLKIISFNAGLFKVAPGVDVPKYEQRRKHLIPVLKQADFDILCLQEVFYPQDIRALRDFAESEGYYFYRGSPGIIKNRHGLVILVKKSLSADGPPQFYEQRFRAVAWYERLFRYEKGLLIAELLLQNGKKLSFANSHLTAFAMRKKIRTTQLNEMVRAISRLESDYLFLIGDLNDTMKTRETDTTPNVVQSLISRYHFVDSYSAVNPHQDEPTVSWRENPIADEGITTNLEHVEEERIDFILATSQKESHVWVENSGRAFTEDLPLKIKLRPRTKTPFWNIWGRLKERNEQKACKLSDHFAVFADLTVF